MDKIQKEIFEMEQELGVPSHLRWHNSKPKQETTLEEAAKRLYQEGLQNDLGLSFHDGVKFGAKWQEEQNGLTPNDLIEFSKWVNKMGYSHRLTLIPNDLIDFYLKNRENIIKLNLE